VNLTCDLRQCVLLATKCALTVQSDLRNFSTTIDNETYPLAFHMGIGCGMLTSLHVGGVFNRWEYVVAGPAMRQIAIAEPLAEPGETVLSPEAWQVIIDVVDSVSVLQLQADAEEAGIKRRAETPTLAQASYVRVDALHIAVEPPAAVAAPASARLTTRHIPLLRRYIPAAVQPKLHAGHSGHLAELRQVSVLFARYTGVDLAAAANGSCAEAIDSGHHLMLHVQRAIYTWEGSINKFMVDDKGLVVLCVFGLPPMAHADDAKRAAAAAKMLTDNTEELGPSVTCSVGVTSGFVFCGVVGAPERREYTVMGRHVNLAARLMAKANNNQVLVDTATMDKSSAYFEYDAVDVGQLKGVHGTTLAYSPIAVKQAISTKKTVLQLEARADEVQQLSNSVGDTTRPGTVIVLTGERGSGKSAVVEQLPAIGKNAGFLVLMGHSKSAARDPDAARDGGDTKPDRPGKGAGATAGGDQTSLVAPTSIDSTLDASLNNVNVAPSAALSLADASPGAADAGLSAAETTADTTGAGLSAGGNAPSHLAAGLDPASDSASCGVSAGGSPLLVASRSADGHLVLPSAVEIHDRRKSGKIKEPPVASSAGSALLRPTLSTPRQDIQREGPPKAEVEAAATRDAAQAGENMDPSRISQAMSDPPPFTVRRSNSLRRRVNLTTKVEIPMDSVEVDLGAWRGVFDQLLKSKCRTSGQTAKACVLRALPTEDLLHAPLLNLFMPFLTITDEDVVTEHLQRLTDFKTEHQPLNMCTEGPCETEKRGTSSPGSPGAGQEESQQTSEQDDGLEEPSMSRNRHYSASTSLSESVDRRRAIISRVPLAKLQPGICVQRLKQILLNLLLGVAHKTQLMIVLHLQTGVEGRYWERGHATVSLFRSTYVS
jgi:class 3 adenylate cyclase